MGPTVVSEMSSTNLTYTPCKIPKPKYQPQHWLKSANITTKTAGVSDRISAVNGRIFMDMKNIWNTLLVAMNYLLYHCRIFRKSCDFRNKQKGGTAPEFLAVCHFSDSEDWSHLKCDSVLAGQVVMDVSKYRGALIFNRQAAREELLGS